MGSILRDLNDKLESVMKEQLLSAPVKEEVTDGKIANYEAYMAQGKELVMAFSTVDTDGTFSTVDGEVTVVLPANKYLEAGKSAEVYATGMLLGVRMQVKVYEVDTINKRAYVELSGRSKYSYESVLRKEITTEICKELDAGKKPVVWGKVVQVTPNKLIVSLLDKGVLGFLGKKYWGKDYIRSLESVCRVGEFLQFEIVGRATKVEGKSTAFLLSRSALALSAWDSVNIEGLEAGGVILVRCNDKPRKKSYWWGSADRLPGIDIMGDFTTKFSYHSNMYVGITYKCKIKFVDREHRKITVIPFEVAPADVPKIERLKSVTNIRGLGSN